MKFLHLSDLHFGLKLYNYDLSEDQEYALDQVVAQTQSERPQAILIAGDVYDKSDPSADAVRLFDRFITKLRQSAPDAEIMLVSGNHDSATRLNLYRDVLDACKIRMIGLPPQNPDEYIEKVTLQDEYGPVNFYLLPFVKPSMIRKIVGGEDDRPLSYDAAVTALLEREPLDLSERNVLVSHQFYLPIGVAPDAVERAASERPSAGNIDYVNANVLKAFDYAALGHLHKPLTLGDEFHRYCGTPIPYSTNEANDVKGAVWVEMGAKGDITARVQTVEPKRRVKVIKGLLEDVLKQSCDDYVSVMLTDPDDLDAAEMQNRLRNAFPRLLEVRRETPFRSDFDESAIPNETVLSDPYELCLLFLNQDLDSATKELLQNVVNSVKEGN